MKKYIKTIILIILIVVLTIITIYLFCSNQNLNNKNKKLATTISSLSKENNTNYNLSKKSKNATSSSKQLNEYIENKTPISEEKAIENIEEYVNNIFNLDRYEFVEIRSEKIDIKTRYIIGENKYAISLETPYEYRILDGDNCYKDAYAIYYITDDELDKFTGYIDKYTGDVLGLYRESP